MKKVLIILLVLCLLGCENKEEDSVDNLSIIVPSGAPSLAFYNELSNSNFNTGDAQSILPELKGENGSDIIVIDTVNGIKALNSGSDYYLAATITFGNFYLASTGIDEDGIMNEGDYIVVFSQGATPDLIFHYIYGDRFDSNLHYVSAVSDASACLIKGINISDDQRDINEKPYVDYVMIAEPALSAALSQNEKASIYENIQDAYKKLSNGYKMIQASVFVSKKLSDKQIDDYLQSLESDIDQLLLDSNVFANAVSGISDNEIKEIFGIPNASLASKVLKQNSIGLGFEKAYDIKGDIDNFISIFEMQETNEEIYYK